MFDFGSIIGGGPGLANELRAGNEYLLDWGKGFKTLASLGLYVRPWLRVRYPDVPVSVGRFESDSFDPESWRPEYPNPAFRNLRPDDAYWGARIVSRFSDGAIRTIVEQARYTDPAATEYITNTPIARRDKVVSIWLNQVNPVDDFRLTASGRLTFENTAVAFGAATPPANYVLTWHAVDNATGAHEPVGDEVWVSSPVSDLPAELATADFVAVVIRGIHRDHPAWLRGTRVHFRRTVEGWETVRVQRAFELQPPVTRPTP